MFGKMLEVSRTLESGGIVPTLKVRFPKFVTCPWVDVFPLSETLPPLTVIPVMVTVTPVAAAVPLFRISKSTVFATPGTRLWVIATGSSMTLPVSWNGTTRLLCLNVPVSIIFENSTSRYALYVPTWVLSETLTSK